MSASRMSIRRGGRWFWAGFVAIGASGPIFILWRNLRNFTRLPDRCWVARWNQFSMETMVEWSKPMLSPHWGDPKITFAAMSAMHFVTQCCVGIVGGCLCWLIFQPCYWMLRACRASGPT